MFKMADILSDNMVLQREQPVNIWGTGDKGRVTVRFNGQTKSADIKNEKWIIVLDAMDVLAEGKTLTAECGEEKVEITNVVVGDVFLASGQSNMRFKLDYLQPEPKQMALDDCNYPNIRMVVEDEWESDVKETQVKAAGTGWLTCNDVNVREYSAPSFFFARNIYKYLDKKVPIGILMAAVGSSRIEKWVDHDILTNCGFKVYNIDDYKVNHFNAMANCLFPYTVKAMLWYQGEANGWPAEFSKNYSKLLGLLALSFRHGLKNIKLPLFVVGLPTYDKDDADYREVRIQQWKACRDDDNMYLAVSTDTGDPNELHPSDKPIIGKRLADLVANKVYNMDTQCNYPVPISMTIDGNDIEVTMSANLTINNQVGFEKLEDKECFEPCQVEVKASKLRFIGAAHAKKIRFGYVKDSLTLGLFSSKGLPAAPFQLSLINAD